MSPRRGETWHSGERGENRDRALRKKIISPKLSKADVLVNQRLDPVTVADVAAARRMITRLARHIPAGDVLCVQCAGVGLHDRGCRDAGAGARVVLDALGVR